jgi:hypothetical protein
MALYFTFASGSQFPMRRLSGHLANCPEHWKGGTEEFDN